MTQKKSSVVFPYIFYNVIVGYRVQNFQKQKLICFQNTQLSITIQKFKNFLKPQIAVFKAFLFTIQCEIGVRSFHYIKKHVGHVCVQSAILLLQAKTAATRSLFADEASLVTGEVYAPCPCVCKTLQTLFVTYNSPAYKDAKRTEQVTIVYVTRCIFC